MKDATDLKPAPGPTEVAEAETDDRDDQNDGGDPDDGWSGKIDVVGSLTNKQLGEE